MGHSRDTNNNDNNNIYIILINKYKREDRKNFKEYLKNVQLLKEDPQYELLSSNEQQKIISEI